MDCRKFIHLLWDQPSKHIDRGKLPSEMQKHLQECPVCQATYADFVRIFGLAAKTEVVRDNDFWQDFDSRVWAKIAAAETAETGQEAIPSKSTYLGKTSISMKHLLTSLGIATASVAIIMLAVSNVVRQNPEAEEADILAEGKEYAPHSMVSPHSQVFSQSPPLNIILKRGLNGRADMNEFSILPKPEVSIVDDSALVTIDEAYLTDEGLENKNVPVIKALSRDVVLNSSHLDSTSFAEMRGSRTEVMPEDWVITVEQMPRMIKAVPPEYPSFAYKLKKGGDVWVKAFVNAEGLVEFAKIYHDSGTNYGFEEAAIKAAYKNQFEPFQVDGVNTPVWVIYKVRFVAKE